MNTPQNSESSSPNASGAIKSIWKTLVLIWRVAAETMSRHYTPKSIKDGVERFTFGTALLLALGAIILIVGSLLLLSSPIHNLSSIVNAVKRFAVWIIGILASLDPAEKDAVTHSLIDNPTQVLTYLVVFGFAISFGISLFLGVMRWTFEGCYASLEFRNFLYDTYRPYYASELLLRFRERFTLMAAIPLSIPKEALMPDPAHPAPPQPRLLGIKPGALDFNATIGPQRPTSWVSRLWQWLVRWNSWRAWSSWHWLIKRATVKAPSRIGYAAIDLDWRQKQDTSCITVVPCTYRNDLDSAYTLGYAHVAWFRRRRYLWLRWIRWRPGPVSRLHRLLKEANRSGNSELTLQTLPDFLKTQVYEPRQGNDKLGIRSQLGVQAIVVFNDYADGGTPEHPNWKIILQRRSKTVASSPEHFQFIPSGGFESHQTYHEKSFDSVLANTLMRECSLERGLLREFAEEVLGISEFASNEILDPDDVYREPAIDRLRELIQTGKQRGSEKKEWAEFHMLGIALSMIGFKPEISFALIIDCKEFFISQRLRRAENEAQGIITWPLDHLAELVSGQQAFVDSSYALVKLFVGNANVLDSLYDRADEERCRAREALVGRIEACFAAPSPDTSSQT